jgi:hypothetical protein
VDASLLEFHIMSKLNYALAFAALAVAALFFLPGKDDAQNAVQKAHNDRCAAFAAAGVEC